MNLRSLIKYKKKFVMNRSKVEEIKAIVSVILRSLVGWGLKNGWKTDLFLGIVDLFQSSKDSTKFEQFSANSARLFEQFRNPKSYQFLITSSLEPNKKLDVCVFSYLSAVSVVLLLYSEQHLWWNTQNSHRLQNVLRALDQNLHFLGARWSFSEVFSMDLWELLMSGDERSNFI